jgi:hypothetical protein
LVLPYEIGSFDPEVELLRRMAFNPDDRIIVNVNPYHAFE